MRAYIASGTASKISWLMNFCDGYYFLYIYLLGVYENRHLTDVLSFVKNVLCIPILDSNEEVNQMQRGQEAEEVISLGTISVFGKT